MKIKLSMLKHVSYLANNIDLIEKQVEEALFHSMAY
jgi:hypothetical protein